MRRNSDRDKNIKEKERVGRCDYVGVREEVKAQRKTEEKIWTLCRHFSHASLDGPTSLTAQSLWAPQNKLLSSQLKKQEDS